MTTKTGNTPPTRRKRRLRLTSVDAVRQYLAGVLTRLENDELDEGQAKSRAYVAQILTKIMETSDLEARIAALESKETHSGE